MDLKTVKKAVAKFYTKNEQKIIVVVSGVSILAAVISSARAGIKAKDVIETYKGDGEKLKAYAASGGLTEEEYTEAKRRDNLQFARDIAIIFAPVAGFTVLSLASIAFGYKVSIAKQTALTVALKGSELALSEWKDKAKEVLGDKKLDKIHEEIVKDKIKELPPPDDIVRKETISKTNHGDDLYERNLYWCFDEWSGRYFVSNWTKIERALTRYGARVRNEMSSPINTLYNDLDPEGDYLPMSSSGSKVGFDVDDLDKGEVPFKKYTIEDEIHGPILVLSLDPCIV